MRETEKRDFIEVNAKMSIIKSIVLISNNNYTPKELDLLTYSELEEKRDRLLNIYNNAKINSLAIKNKIRLKNNLIII